MVYVNAELARLGYAWVYRKYANNQNLFVLEDAARAAGRGLWGSDGAIPPWEWRREGIRGPETSESPSGDCTGPCLR